MNLGAQIQAARKSAGLTQRDLYEWLRIPVRTLQDWESGRNTPSEWATLLIVEKIERDGSNWKSQQ